MSDEVKLPSVEQVEQKITQAEGKLIAAQTDARRWRAKLVRLRALLGAHFRAGAATPTRDEATT